MDNSIQDNSTYAEGGIINYSGFNSQDRYLMSNGNSAFSTTPSSRNSFEMSSGGNQRQAISSQVSIKSNMFLVLAIIITICLIISDIQFSRIILTLHDANVGHSKAKNDMLKTLLVCTPICRLIGN
jgi:hypothetical protein